jgi:hypothetical protein
MRPVSRKITISVDDAQYRVIRYQAESKGLRPSQFTKMALFSHIAKYPAKGVMTVVQGEEGADPTFLRSESDSQGG